MDTINLVAAGLCISGQLGDIATSLLAYKKGFVEGNPLLKNLSHPELVLVKALITVFGVAAALLIPLHLGAALAIGAGIAGGVQTFKTLKLL